MSADLDHVDLAKNLVALARVLDDVILRKLREYAAGLITEWSTPEKADDLAAVLEETARQVRLCRPNPPEADKSRHQMWPDRRTS